MRRTWSLINETIKPSAGKGRGNISKLNVDGVTIDDPNDIANAINRYFSSIGSNIANSISNNYDHKLFLRGSYVNSLIRFSSRYCRGCNWVYWLVKK